MVVARKTNGKGKQPKNFLDLNAARGLAESIADSLEKKTQKKVDKRAQATHAQPHSPALPRKSESRIKLKETKALLAAKQSESKKARKKRRKQLSSSDPAPAPTEPKKRVSFA
ncbi:hypothetical protein MKEN_01354200 [Mycena kentingensis (nom. inval.)]|nr:hypothetical protein MKEN_01354200 [Mycena kentingensis (nom. inval.)]